MAGGGALPNQTALQSLLMNAYQDPKMMSEIQRELQKRMMEKKSADYTGMGAAGSYGKMSLDQMAAQASDQPSPGGIINMLSNDIQDVGGNSFLGSIWDAARF